MDYKYVESKGAKIFYHERGAGEPLVMIMGFGADGKVWEKHVSIYEKHFRCILLDNRGVGLSDQPNGPYSTSMMADDTIAVMDHAGVSKAMLIGISMGGAIAQEIAINYPLRVKSLLLVSTWARFNNYTKSVYENLKYIRNAADKQHFMELLQLWLFAPPFYEDNMESLKTDAEDAGKNPTPQSRNGFEGQLDACIHHNCVERLHQINVPTLITVGTMDILAPPAFSQELHKCIKQSQISFYSQCGHVHHWEKLERFNKETLQFLLSNKHE